MDPRDVGVCEVLDVVRVVELPAFGDDGPELLFEHLPVFAQPLVSVVIVLTVLGDLVDEEQGEDLDTLGEQLALLVKMGQDGLSDLDAALPGFGDITDSLSRIEDSAIAQGDSVRETIDVRDEQALVRFDVIGCLIQVVLLAEDMGLVADSGGMAHEDLHPRSGCCLPGIDPFQIDVPLGPRQVVDPHALHAYLLHEFLVVRIEGIKGIDLVVMGHMRGGEVHREQGVEVLAKSLLRLAVVLSELLGLIQDEDRPVGGDDVDGAS